MLQKIIKIITFVLIIFIIGKILNKKYILEYQLSERRQELEENRQLLKKAIRFYGAQRCGNGNNWLLRINKYGNSCHLTDGLSYKNEIDLKGGWHDAGDHIKFTLTIAYSAYALLKGFDAFPQSYQDLDNPEYFQKPNGIPDILDEVKYATDYLIKTNPDNETVIARVGDDSDHKVWVTSPFQFRLPKNKGGGIRAVYDNSKADICGSAAAALALMSNLYCKYDRRYSDQCLKHAKTIYKIGLENPGTTQDSLYQTSLWEDKMMCAAIEIYRMTNEENYLNDAVDFERELGPTDWVLDWGHISDYGRHSLIKAGYVDAIKNWTIDMDRYLKKKSDDHYIKGLAWFSNWGSLRYAVNAAFSASLYYEIVKKKKIKKFVLSQLRYVMGDNEYQRSFIIGWGQSPPLHPHHRNAYGRNDPNSWDLSGLPLLTLEGAMVGGPRKKMNDSFPPGFFDEPRDYIANEVSIEYNAGLVGVLAFALSQ